MKESIKEFLTALQVVKRNRAAILGFISENKEKIFCKGLGFGPLHHMFYVADIKFDGSVFLVTYGHLDSDVYNSEELPLETFEDLDKWVEKKQSEANESAANQWVG